MRQNDVEEFQATFLFMIRNLMVLLVEGDVI